MAVLFVGNGVNLNEGISVSWDELLKEICSESTEDISHALGMTLRYEYIDCITKEYGLDLKKKIAVGIMHIGKAVCGKKQPIHAELMKADLSCILTTNYDYALEYAADPDFKPARTTTERDYSFRRYQEAGGMRVYHIHGECGRPSSVCLGFEHYAGMLEKMRGALVKSTSRELGGEHVFHLYDVLSGVEPVSQEWYYKMFLEDIYFLGFGFDASEQDIWWLLCYRKKVKDKYPWLVDNHLYLLDIEAEDKKKDLDETAKRKMLRAFGVEIISCTGSSYEEKYAEAVSLLNVCLADRKEEENI